MSAKPLARIRRIPKKRPVVDPALAAITRMTDIMLEHDLPSKDIKKAYAAIHDHMFLRLQQVIARNAKENSWDFMKGAYYQASELYAVASLAYYGYDSPLMTDSQYDSLCKFLHENYLSIPSKARAEYRLSANLLRAGSGYIYSNARLYPSIYNYDQRLSALKQERQQKHVRAKASNKPRLLRKAPIARIRRIARKL